MHRIGQTKFDVEEGERIDDLVRNNLQIIQKPGSFCFSIDAVLLANFATVKKGDKIVDLGTGSGVIPLLLSTRQQVSHITGLDIQQAVVKRAQRSVAGNQLQDIITILEGDLKQASATLGAGKFDLVTSNPPYLPGGRGKINPNDEIAVARHEICCCLEDVIRESSKLLNSHGRFALVHRPERLADIMVLMRKYSLEPKRMQMVYPTAGKKPNIVLIEAVKGAMADLNVIPPLFVYDEKGHYTKELLDVYYPGR